MLSRRGFLATISAAAVVTVAKANVPLGALDIGALVEDTPAWMPDGFMLPRGQQLSRLMYRDLFHAIGTNFGAGPTTFTLPNLEDRNGGDIKYIIAAKSTDRVPAGMLIQFYAPVAA